MGMFRLYLSIVLFAGIQLTANGQCTGNALWLNEENDGDMKDTALIGGSVMVYASTSGTMTSGRPLYRTTSSLWKGVQYGGLQVWRAYSSIGSNYTSFKLSTPLDSNFIHVRVDNIRGDFPNMESQNVRGYYQGTEVPASFKDPVNGATQSGNTIHGASNTNSTTQSAMRVFFHGAVDSIVIRQTSFSDWIIAELMIECNFLLADLVPWSAEKNDQGVLMQWTCPNSSPIQYFEIERSTDGIRFQLIKRVYANPPATSYSAQDRDPSKGKNFYRLKIIHANGHTEYSNIIVISWSMRSVHLSIFPNPATDVICMEGPAQVSWAEIYSMDGRKVFSTGPFTRLHRINTAHWPRGEYIVRAGLPGEIETRKIILR